MYMYVCVLGVLCCFALFVCLTLLASFFLPSHLSFKNVCVCVCVCVCVAHVHVHGYCFLFPVSTQGKYMYEDVTRSAV